MRIIKEDLTGCINRIAAGAPATKYWVIAEPISETGICKEFTTEADAQEFIDKQNCRFYKKDLDAQREAEEMETAMRASIGEENWKAMSEWAEQELKGDGPLAKCGLFCKYYRCGRGFPGEYVDYCSAPGNEHIINVDFRESEII